MWRRTRGWLARTFCLLLLLTVPGLGRADFTAPCYLSGLNGTHEVAKLVIPPAGAEISSMGASITNPVQAPFVDRQSYLTVLGFYVIEAATRKLVLWDVEFGGGDAPGAVVKYNGTTYYRNPHSPVTPFMGVQGGEDSLMGGALLGGTYYIVAFGYGASQGAFGSGTWQAYINTGIACTRLSAPGEIVRYNHTDFDGPTHIYAGVYGTGRNLKLSYNVPADTAGSGETRNTVFGALYATTEFLRGGALPDIGWLQLRYKTPTMTTEKVIGTQQHEGSLPFVSSNGDFDYTLNYYGFEPLVDITFLQVDLP